MADVKQLTAEETAKFTELVKKEREMKTKAWGYLFAQREAVIFAKAHGFEVDKVQEAKYIEQRKQEEIRTKKW
jgi:hypothetical protein